MKALLFILALLCGGSATAASMFQTRCDDAMRRAVTVLTSQENGYSIDNTQSFRSLTALKGHAGANAYVLGLTRAQGRLSIGLEGELIRDPLSGYECVAPKIDVSLYYTPIVIYVGSEFEPGTCAYQEILAHEMRHLKTYLDHLPKVERTVRKALAKRFDNRPLYARSGQANASLKREIDTGWMPYMKRELASVEVQQAEIDTPEEYARLSRVCKGEVQSLIGPVNRTK
ncbi:MAG: hypothetical protein V4631_11200 [Pseudomonadota bacterium]